MSKYHIHIEYFEPLFGEVILEAKNESEAEDLAMIEFERLYPEAVDAKVVLISEIIT
jgi:hypothetical protein